MTSTYIHINKIIRLKKDKPRPINFNLTRQPKRQPNKYEKKRVKDF